MRLAAAFFRLIRLPNLFFIALAQVLFQFCIYYPLYRHALPEDDAFNFSLLVLASLFIAAAGYVINDYFDINIDEINKPQKMVVDKVIHRRWAIAWHFILSFTGIILTALAIPILEKWYLILANLASIALLWFYSTNFKKSLLIGNIVISHSMRIGVREKCWRRCGMEVVIRTPFCSIRSARSSKGMVMRVKWLHTQLIQARFGRESSTRCRRNSKRF